ncbi:hypothetical protein GGD81_002906 [Rhodobium orientis]|nr:hypothetical protein [Rhodobium orientis]MBB4303854.1 hypothetical protein [Rhodobium orientis]
MTAFSAGYHRPELGLFKAAETEGNSQQSMLRKGERSLSVAENIRPTADAIDSMGISVDEQATAVTALFNPK